MRPFVLTETNLKSVRENPPEVAVLPWGSTEPHNLHLPYGTDAITVTKVGEMACELAWQRGAKVCLLPTIPYGVNSNLFGFPMTINMNPSTQLKVLQDIVESLRHAGVNRLLILNGHGGNDFNPLQRELYDCGVFIAVCNWWMVGSDLAGEIFESTGDHADEMETSVALHLFPEFVAPLSQADDGRTRTTRFEAINRGWVKITRPWHKFTVNSGAGNPAKASAQKGKRYIDAVVARIADFLVELAKAELDEDFPY